MNPNRVDSLVDLGYGLLIAVSVGLILVVGDDVGLAFGFGVSFFFAQMLPYPMQMLILQS